MSWDLGHQPARPVEHRWRPAGPVCGPGEQARSGGIVGAGRPADPKTVTPWNRIPTRALAGALGLTVLAATVVGLAAPAHADVAISRHEVTVVAARWEGVGGDAAAADLLTAVAGLIDGPVDAAWSADSLGAVRFATVRTLGWVDVSAPACRDSRVADIGSIWSQVVAATGWMETARSHLVVVTPRVDCGGAEGVATMAGVGLDRSGLVWVNGVPTASVLAHELGHNLGLNHSNTLSCVVGGERVTDAEASQCTSHEYMDLTDVMGISHQHIGALNPVHLARLGLLDASQLIDIDAASVGEYALASYASAERRMLRLRTPTATYYVVFRSNSGRDAWLTDGGGFGDPGVAIYKSVSGGPLNPTVSYLLDAHVVSADSDLSNARTVLDVGASVRLADDVLVSTMALEGEVARVWIGPRPVPVATPQVVSAPVAPIVVMAPPAPVVMPPVPPASPLSKTPVPDETPDALNDAPAGPGQSDLEVSGAPVAPEETPTEGRAPDATATPVKDSSVVLVHDAPAVDVSYRGDWRTRTWRDAGEGSVHTTTTPGATVRLRVTGSQMRILGARGQNYGRLVVRVDGTRVAVVDLEGPRGSLGAVSRWISLPSSGTHTITLIARGDGPVVFDGLQIRETHPTVNQ